MSGRAKYKLDQLGLTTQSSAELTDNASLPGVGTGRCGKIVKVLPKCFLSTNLELEKPPNLCWLADSQAFVIQLLYASEMGYALDLPVGKSRIIQLSDNLLESTCEIMLDIFELIAAHHEVGDNIVISDTTGRSRPPAVLIALLMRQEYIPLPAAWTTIHDAYPAMALSHDMAHFLLRFNSTCGHSTAIAAGLELASLCPATTMPSPPRAKDTGVQLENLFVYKQMDHQDASFILPGVWIGNEASATCVFWLKFHNITRIINCAQEIGGGEDAMLREAGILSSTCLGIEETPEFDALAPLKCGVEALRTAHKANENVLVHCALGINRSVSTVAAYLMTHHGLTLLDALTFIRERRPIARPNAEMYPHLLTLESHLFGSTSVPAKLVNEHFPY
jgi:protein-tyrosine phosphatase